ncbi:GNAT family N-acetyltransferase [Crossiella cryophila]|uniref:GNAT superfamily N-acetyltransferase n=1 Tax=Crossiella cryophila TaxID=43355 RepID=A0A7W7FSL5_9PSEU|nr:GNAT family N-acetyltransferase [Crossiella cryophila]MBB4676085.1 GNAT superfamily N-acetyltransferase [Crossiella cryophila]
MTDFQVRPAVESDLRRLAEFEAEIARISFQDDAIDDLDVQEKRMAKAMAKSAEGMFVACRGDEPAAGWLWITVNTNPMSGQRYANFRSLAVAEIPERTQVGELLLQAGLDHVDAHGVTEVVGKVFSGNLPMRVLYRQFGFEAAHLTMKLDRRKR